MSNPYVWAKTNPRKTSAIITGAGIIFGGLIIYGLLKKQNSESESQNTTRRQKYQKMNVQNE